MVQRGPKPAPTALRLLQGGDPRKGNQAEPQMPRGEMPQAPPWISVLALEEWERVCDDLFAVGILTQVDVTMLAAYCLAYAHWRKSEDDWDRAKRKADADPHDKTFGAALVETSNSNLIQNPLIGIVNVARRDMARLAAEFGLSPSSRTLIESTKTREGDPIGAKYFGRER